MIEISKEALLQLLKEEGQTATLDKETGQVTFKIKIKEHDYRVFLRIFEKNNLLQLLAFMPFSLDLSTLNDLSRCLHFLNKELDIPGFGLDESSKTCFYRVVLPFTDNKIEKEILRTYLKASSTILQSFSPLLFAITSGGMTFDQLLKVSKNAS